MNYNWIESALGIHPDYSANPLWGHIAEGDDGELYLPGWWWSQRKHLQDSPGGWWARRLNLRNPFHWGCYLRSRIAGRVAMVEAL